MRPEREAVGAQPLGVLKQRGADPAPLRVGVDEEVSEHIALKRREGDDAAVLFDDPGLALGEESLANEAARLVGRVERRKPRLGGACGREYLRDCVGVRRCRASGHGRRLRGCPAIRTSPFA